MSDVFEVHTDASLNERYGMAAVAVTRADGTLLGAEIASAANINVAEVIAAIRGTAYLAARGMPAGSTVVTDAIFIPRQLGHEGGDWRQIQDQMVVALLGDLDRFLKRRGYRVRWGGRDSVHSADRFAHHMLKAWVAGRQDESTWRRPMLAQYASMAPELAGDHHA